MKKSRRVTATEPPMGAPFLRRVASLPEKFDVRRFPFNIRAFSHGIDLPFRTNVTFFVGENGTGKSTLLEAIAECCGFNPAAATAIITGRRLPRAPNWRRRYGCRGCRG